MELCIVEQSKQHKITCVETYNAHFQILVLCLLLFSPPLLRERHFSFMLMLAFCFFFIESLFTNQENYSILSSSLNTAFVPFAFSIKQTLSQPNRDRSVERAPPKRTSEKVCVQTPRLFTCGSDLRPSVPF